MTTLEEALASLPRSASDTIQAIAQSVADQYKGFVEPEDLYSEFMLWLAERPARADNWHFVNDEGKPKFGWRSLKRDAAKVMIAHAKIERVRSLGLVQDDALEYGLEQIKELLPYVWREPTVFVRDREQTSPTSTPSDPLTQPDQMIRVFDVRIAYAKVIHQGGPWDRTLRAIYLLESSQIAIARQEGVGSTTISRWHRSALEAIYREVNAIPDVLGDDGPGSRKVMSNRAAIALTQDDGDGE